MAAVSAAMPACGRCRCWRPQLRGDPFIALAAVFAAAYGPAQ